MRTVFSNETIFVIGNSPNSAEIRFNSQSHRMRKLSRHVFTVGAWPRQCELLHPFANFCSRSLAGDEAKTNASLSSTRTGGGGNDPVGS